jgi:hypothetical protein
MQQEQQREERAGRETGQRLMHRRDPLGKGVLAPRPLPPCDPSARRTGSLVSCAYSPFGPFVRSDVSGVQVLWGRPCLVLEPVRAFAFGQGVRAPTLGGVRLGTGYPKGSREWNPPQHMIKLMCHLLVGLEKHRNAARFLPCIRMDDGLAHGEGMARQGNARSVVPTVLVCIGAACKCCGGDRA